MVVIPFLSLDIYDYRVREQFSFSSSVTPTYLRTMRVTLNGPSHLLYVSLNIRTCSTGVKTTCDEGETWHRISLFTRASLADCVAADRAAATVFRGSF